jgi:ABC-type transport system involved in multi-copper enzyme maturation permease subunit
MRFNLIPQLPLLRRELTELANRRRTYIVRLIGAVILLSIVFVVLRTSISRATSMGGPGGFAMPAIPGMPPAVARIRLLGIGGQIFPSIVPWLFHAIQLLMPALCCGTITMEKERNTLGTLLLTRLSPMAIILEKLGSRLIPMLTFLLLTFPVLAYVYSLGGVDTNILTSTLWLLLCECLLYASIGMLCSSWFRTTVSAFIASYVMVLILQLSSVVLRRLTPTPYDIWRAEYQGLDFSNPQFLLNMVTGAAGKVSAVMESRLTWLGIDFSLLLQLAVSTLPSLFVTVTFVALARFFLFRRAFVTSSSPLLKLFRVLDRFFVKLNEGTTRGIEIVKDSNAMPEFDPIAWRERTRKSLGKARYLFRILTVLEVPTIFICALTAISSAATGFSGLRALLAMMWVLTVLVLTVKASTAISGERARETIEPLLSTPMTAAQIISEKIVGMRRLMIVLSVPLLTIHFTLMQLMNSRLSILYAITAVVATFNSMLMITWVSAGLGMRFLSQTKSLMAGIAAVVTWIMVPLMGSIFLLSILGPARYSYSPYEQSSFSNAGVTLVTLPLWCSPAGPVLLNELALNAGAGQFDRWTVFARLTDSPATLFGLTIVVLAFQIFLLYLIRLIVLRLAPRLLNRLESHPDHSELSQVALSSQPVY